MSSALRFRPMGIGDLLDETVNLYRRNFLLFVSIEATILVPVAAVQIILAPGGVLDPSRSALAGTFVAAAISIVGEFIVQAAMMQAISAVCLGEPMSLGDAYVRARRRLWSLLGLTLVYSLVFGLLFATIIGIPFAVYLSIAWGMSYPILLLEGAGIRQSLGRSRKLVRGSWWRLLGIIILTSLFTSIVGSIFSIPGSVVAFTTVGLHVQGGAALLSTIIEQMIFAAGRAIAGPITACCWVLTYYDLKVRKEGFDLELQSRTIGAIE